MTKKTLSGSEVMALIENSRSWLVYDLFEYLKHGDEDHQAWLKEAIACFFEGKERPPAR